MRILRRLLASLGLVAATAQAGAGPGDPPPYAAAFDRAFAPGFSVETRTRYEGGPRVERVPFKAVAAGDIVIVSERIAAADPFVALAEQPAFVQPVPNGAFPVRLAVAAFPTGGLRVTFARVDFAPRPAVRWTMALIEGQDTAELGADEIFGYGVDAGTGAFFDPVAGKAARTLLEANADAWEQWQTDGEALGPKIIGPYQFLLNLPLGDANVIMFGSGWGDGFYASWFGYDAEGRVVVLVTDFQTIDWPTAKW